MRAAPFDEIRHSLSSILSSDEISLLPNKWEKIGAVLILRLPVELHSQAPSIAKEYARALQCKSVLLDKGGITGPLRTPVTDLIYGDPDTETIHKENGIRFVLDPAQVMFSSGNMDERIRMASIASNDEVVVDFFAGIGYFSIPLAVHSRPEQVISCELNPVAYEFLCKNILLNGVDGIVKPLLGDSRQLSPKNSADRVILGYFGDTKRFLPAAVESLNDNVGTIHFHDTFPDEKVPGVAMTSVEETVKEFHRSANLIGFHKIKSYAPGIGHYVFDVKVEGL